MALEHRVAEQDERSALVLRPASGAAGAAWRRRDLADRALRARLLLALGLLALGAGLDDLWAHRLDRPEPVAARVLASGAEPRTPIEMGTYLQLEMSYAPVVRLAYRRAGVEREALLEPGGVGGRAWAEAKAARYAPGAALTAWVDPARPERALRSPRSPGGALGAALGLLLTGLSAIRLRALSRA